MELAFGEFRLDTARKMLWHGQTFVPLGARAYAILSALVEQPGRLVTKAELFERAWPGISVDAANLRVQVANLRKVLGDAGRNIVTEQSLGYRFAGEVRRLVGSSSDAATKRFRPPAALRKPLGREEATASVQAALRQHRLVTIVGPGGIGKTTLALEVASRCEDAFTDGVCFVDLGFAADAPAVAAAVAVALERPVMDNPLAAVRAYLRTRHLLLVLDCCDRVIEASADLAATVLAAAPGVAIVATSREAMRAAGECVEHLQGLSLPPEGPVAAEGLQEFGATALFCRTAMSVGAGFELTDANATIVASICRRLDGIPLAIDLAAGLTGTLSVEQIGGGLVERMSIPAFGRRGGPTRHRTLDAAITWSYETLDRAETVALQRLTVFADSFTLEGAVDVIAFGDLDPGSAKRAVVSLAQKSLLHLHHRLQSSEYRLLETTRGFVSARIEDSDERRQGASRYVGYLLGRLSRIDWEDLEFVSDRGSTFGLVTGVREAIDWAYADEADVLLPIRLVLAAERLWLELSLFSEHGTRMEEARVWLERLSSEHDGYASLLAGVLSGIACGVFYQSTDEERIEVVLEALRRAKDVGDTQRYMRNLSYAFFYHVVRHQGHQALNYAEQLEEEARAADQQEVVEYAVVAAANARTQIGDWRRARSDLENYLRSSEFMVSRVTTVYLGFNTVVLALLTLAVINGSEGKTSRCFEDLDRAIALTDKSHQSQARFQLLYFGACRMAFRCGDISRARAYLDLLERQAREFTLWQFMTIAYQGWMAFAEGRVKEAKELLEGFCNAANPVASLQASFFLLLADVRCAAGDLDGADEAVARAFRVRTGDQDPFAVGPVLRASADILAARAVANRWDEAAELYTRAIENARRYGAVTAEIPAALGLARLEMARGRRSLAHEVLSSVHARAPDGHDLPPMRQVIQLLSELEATAMDR